MNDDQRRMMTRLLQEIQDMLSAPDIEVGVAVDYDASELVFYDEDDKVLGSLGDLGLWGL